MAKKTARVYTLDELKEKSQKALDDPKLVEIVKSAPLNKDGEVNLSWVYGQAEDYVHEQTKDLKKTKELAVAARFLAMLRRDFAEEFEKLISERKTNVLNENNKIDEPEYTPVQDKKFSLPPNAEVIMSLFKNKDFSIRPDTEIQFWGSSAISFCNKLLSAFIDDSFSQPVYQLEPAPRNIYELKKLIIQLLEEKFGLKVKVCGHCKYYVPDNRQYVYSAPDGQCFYRVPDGYPGKKNNFSDTCERDWTPKELPEKPSSV